MNDIFSELGRDDITVHVLLDLQERYPDLSDRELASYIRRVDLRIGLLKAFAENNRLPVGFDLVSVAIEGVDTGLLKKRCSVLNVPDKASLPTEGGEKWVIMMNGGPGTGKSSRIAALDLPDDTLILDRDAMFAYLSPYERLREECPEHATHAVVCEAILYNEGDAYRYSLLCAAPHLLVDGTMSYLDLGKKMITEAQKHGYHVKVINVDCPIEEAENRAEARAKRTGKTINRKLLYESHVRTALHFFEYLKMADETECWYNEGKIDMRRIASSRMSSEGAVEQRIEDEAAFERFWQKGEMPLDNPSWPPDFQAFLNQRKCM